MYNGRRCSTCGKVPYIKSSKIRKVPHGNMPYANGRLPWVGRLSGSWLLIRILVDQEHPPMIEKAFSVWLQRWDLAMWGWHHLLELCSMTGTLILDEDGLYDPATFNDRLLLGMKGTMSEAELHILRARLRG